uniref:Uncharacterized protein n=1 Tax=Parascaris univalens TaxID=6257 RepID=A0A915A7P1_PARUN
MRFGSAVIALQIVDEWIVTVVPVETAALRILVEIVEWERSVVSAVPEAEPVSAALARQFVIAAPQGSAFAEVTEGTLVVFVVGDNFERFYGCDFRVLDCLFGTFR